MPSTREKIVSWLADEDFEVHIESPPPGTPFEWVVRATSKIPVKANVIIQQPKEKKDRVVVTLGVMISDYHRSKMRTLDDLERASISFEIYRDLITVCPDCLVLIQQNIADPESIVITRILYEEQIDRPTIVNTVKMLVNMFSMLVLKLTSRFGPLQQSKREPSPDTLGYI